MLDKIIRTILYSTIFLIPVFFLPWTVYPVAYHKQMLLALLVLTALLLWVVKCLVEKKIVFRFNLVSWLTLGLVAVSAVSTIFSSSPYQSFWGTGLEPDAFWNLLMFGLFFFLVANSMGFPSPLEGEGGGEGGASKILTTLLASNILVSLLFLLQNFFNILPWDFAQVAGWSPAESVYALALFSAGALGLSLLVWPSLCLSLRATERSAAIPSVRSLRLLRLRQLADPRNDIWRWLVIVVAGVLNFSVVIIVNYWLAWLGLIFFSLAFLWNSLRAKNFAVWKIIAPTFLLVVGLFFVVVRPNLPTVISLPLEVTPGYIMTWEIAQKTLSEGVKEFLIGTGPATFGYQYQLYKPAEINLTDFWQVRFAAGRAWWLTLLATSGVLSVLAVILILVGLIWQEIKYSRKDSVSPLFWGALYFGLLGFVYPPNFLIGFSFFLLLGLWLALDRGKQYSFELNGQPLKVFVLILSLVIVTVAVLLGLGYSAKRYAAQIIYWQGLKVAAQDIDRALINLDQAARLDTQDIYLRNLAEASLVKMKQVLENNKISQEEKNQFLTQWAPLVVSIAQEARNRNPVDSLNWLELGLVYENLMPLVQGAGLSAIDFYQEALKRDPSNPQIYFQIGRVYYQLAQSDKQELETVKQSKKRAKEQETALQNNVDVYTDKAKNVLEQALGLKSNFTPAQELLKLL